MPPNSQKTLYEKERIPNFRPVVSKALITRILKKLKLLEMNIDRTVKFVHEL